MPIILLYYLISILILILKLKFSHTVTLPIHRMMFQCLVVHHFILSAFMCNTIRSVARFSTSVALTVSSK
jgi:hypothetical protein